MSKESGNIKFLVRDEIDSSWWDNLILSSASPLIYAEADYLDFMCPGWCAFYHEDTETVMPFPLKRKFGINYALQPPFIQQLGLFSKKKLTENLIREFITSAMGKVRLIHLHLNYSNQLPELKTRTNFIIRLNKPFQEIQRNFRKDLIHKSSINQIKYQNSDLEESFAFYKRRTSQKTHQNKKSLQQFYELCRFYQSKGRFISRKIELPSRESVCVSIFLKDDHRIYYMLSASSDEGRRLDANAFLLHEVIREFSETNLIFDFEGSEIPGVKFFFQKFSPEPQPYPSLEINKLSFAQKKLIQIRNLFR